MNRLQTSLHPNKPAIGHQQAGQLLFHRRGVILLLLLLLKGARQLLSFASAPREREEAGKRNSEGAANFGDASRQLFVTVQTLWRTHTHKILTWHPPPVVFSPRCVCLKTMLPYMHYSFFYFLELFPGHVASIGPIAKLGRREAYSILA